ncbi:MAG: SUMF1/EgtB/PvdO family nonheme iron enzyme [Bryobacterales bacterium]|nr:SUMF1/EgtB/PvdO family nonheme iron enzyme [Bryobacterales bacterium]
MARLTMMGAALAAAFAAWAGQQPAARTELQQAGVCARCHVVSVLEWGISGHRKTATDCVACHGESRGHVINERNEVKPDRIPRGTAVAGLCITCHQGGCPKTKAKASCGDCHHFHALVNPKQPPSQVQDAPPPPKPAARKPARRVPQGLEAAGGEFDATTGLPKAVTVANVGMAMLLAPGGEFDIGDERWENTRPVHTVRVEPFYLGKFEVTQAEWKRVMGQNPSAQPGDALPVERVSWQDCQAFLAKLNEQVPGGGFRLPTEAEWEYACRAGRAPVEGEALARVAWYRGNSMVAEKAGGEFQQTEAWAPRAVGTREANPWGFHDMQGNVWEWCSSLFRPYVYKAEDGRESPGAAGMRVMRGGGYADAADSLHPAFRHAERPDRRLRWNGLRVARSVRGE